MALVTGDINKGVMAGGTFDSLQTWSIHFNAVKQVVPHPGEDYFTNLYQGVIVVRRDFIKILVGFLADLPNFLFGGPCPPLHLHFQAGMVQNDFLQFQFALWAGSDNGAFDLTDGVEQFSPELKNLLTPLRGIF